MKIQENMHMIIGSILLVVCIYFYVNSASKSKILIESFEGKIGKETVDYGASDTSSISVTASRGNSKCGGQSLEMSYHLKPYGYVYAAKGYDLYHGKDFSSWGGGKVGWLVHPDKISWKEYDAFSIYLKGKNVGKVAIDLKDTGGEMWRKTINVESNKWTEFVIPFDDLGLRRDWQPEGAVLNKYIDYPFKSFHIEPKTPGSATLYADCAKFIEL